MNLIRKICYALAGMGLLTQSVSGAPYTDYFDEYQQKYETKHEFEIHRIQHGQYILHVRDFGPLQKTDDSEVPTLIMMHGFPDSQILYDELAPKLAKRYRVITFDFLGWGSSDTPADHNYSANQLTADLDTVVTALDLQRVVLVMHDLSGLPAIDWSLANPDKTAGLVLLNTVYGPSQALVVPEAIQFYATPNPLRTEIENVVLNSDFLWLSGVEIQVSKFFHKRKARDTYLRLFLHEAVAIRPAFLDLTESIFSDVAERAVAHFTLIPQMQLPVTIIFGQDDPYLNPGVALEFHNLFSNSQLHLVENAGHYVQLDQPGAVSDLIKDYMETNWGRD